MTNNNITALVQIALSLVFYELRHDLRTSNFTQLLYYLLTPIPFYYQVLPSLVQFTIKIS